MFAVVLLLAAGAAAEDLPLNGAKVDGWSKDGAQAVFAGSVHSIQYYKGTTPPYEECPVGAYNLKVVADASGKVQRVFQHERGQCVQRPGKDDLAWRARPEGEALWARSEPRSAWDRFWNPGLLTNPVREQEEDLLEDQALDRERSIGGGKEPAAVRVDVTSGKNCPAARLVVTLGKITGALADDHCEPGEKAGKDVESYVRTSWSPDGTRLAVAWEVVRAAPRNPAGVRHAHVTVASRRVLASVDLLDAGAGAKADVLALRLSHAGFRVAHRGKALTARPSTAVFFAPGFEPEAREVAAVIGAKSDAVQPLSWDSPYSITVAAAREGG